VEELFAVAEVANLCADRVGDVLDRLLVAEVMYDFLLLGMWSSIRRNAVRIVRPLHACDCAHAAVAEGRVDNAWHKLLVVAFNG
jgi:hypothetical protein